MKECPFPECSAGKLMETSLKMVEDVKQSNSAYRTEIKDQIGNVHRAVEKLVSSDSSMALMIQRALSANELVNAAIMDLKETNKESRSERENIFSRLRELEKDKAGTGSVEKLREDMQVIERNMVTKSDIAKLLGAFALLLTIIQVIIAIVK